MILTTVAVHVVVVCVDKIIQTKLQFYYNALRRDAMKLSSVMLLFILLGGAITAWAGPDDKDSRTSDEGRADEPVMISGAF